jgi:hypothetical protein
MFPGCFFSGVCLRVQKHLVSAVHHSPSWFRRDRKTGGIVFHEYCSFLQRADINHNDHIQQPHQVNLESESAASDTAAANLPAAT